MQKPQFIIYLKMNSKWVASTKPCVSTDLQQLGSTAQIEQNLFWGERSPTDPSLPVWVGQKDPTSSGWLLSSFPLPPPPLAAWLKWASLIVAENDVKCWRQRYLTANINSIHFALKSKSRPFISENVIKGEADMDINSSNSHLLSPDYMPGVSC